MEKQIKLPVEIRPMKYRLTKLKDTKFNGNHPNGYDEGIEIYGHSITELNVGERFCILEYGKYTATSPVTEILSPTEFRTMNSIYKLEILED